MWTNLCNKKVQDFYQLITTTIETDSKIETKAKVVVVEEKIEEKLEEKVINKSDELTRVIKLFNLSEYEYKN